MLRKQTWYRHFVSPRPVRSDIKFHHRVSKTALQVVLKRPNKSNLYSDIYITMTNEAIDELYKRQMKVN